MPTLSLFYGILIKMNWKDIGQHKAPHFHAFYGEYEAVFGMDGEIYGGQLSAQTERISKGVGTSP